MFFNVFVYFNAYFALFWFHQIVHKQTLAEVGN